MRQLLVFVIALSMVPLLSGPGTAEGEPEPGWEPAPSSPSGAAIWGLGGSSAALVASSIGNGAFYSLDNGRTWQAATTDVDEGEIAFDPSTPLRGYLAGFGGMDRTDDGGVTWTKVIDESPVSRVDVAPDGTVVAAARHDGGVTMLHVSTDGGQTFSVVPSPLPPWNSVYGLVFGDTSDDIFLMTFGKTYVSHDGGASWTQPTDGGRDIIRTGDGEIWIAGWGNQRRSTDNGATWELLPAPPANPQILASRPDGAVFGTTSSGLLLTEDDGVTWTNLGYGEVAWAATAMLADPEDPGAVLIGDENLGVNRVFPAGAEYGFEGRSNGFPPIEVTAFGGSADGSVLLAGGDLGMYASHDGGQTWAHTGAGIGHPSMWAVGANADGSLLMAGGRGWILQPYMMVSLDSGATWRAVYTGMSDGVVPAFAAHPTDPSRAWAAVWVDLADSMLLETTDGGETWEVALESDAHIADVAYHAPSQTLLVATDAGILGRPDGSVAFAPVSLAPLGSLFVETHGDHIAAEGVGTSVWHNVMDSTVMLPWADTGDFLSTLALEADGTVWAGAEGGRLFRCAGSALAGVCGEDAPGPGTNVAYVDPATGTVWAGTSTDGVFRIVRSP